jgi:hypothetical protein
MLLWVCWAHIPRVLVVMLWGETGVGVEWAANVRVHVLTWWALWVFVGCLECGEHGSYSKWDLPPHYTTVVRLPMPCSAGNEEQHTGIILTSEVCVSVRHSGDLANGRRDV